MPVLTAIFLAVFGGITLFGLYQYQAHNHRWGIKLVLAMCAVALVIGVWMHITGGRAPAVGLVPVVGFAVERGLVYTEIVVAVAAWLWAAGLHGWHKHAFRALGLGLCLGPLSALGSLESLHVVWWTGRYWEGTIGLPSGRQWWALLAYVAPGVIWVGTIGGIASWARTFRRLGGRWRDLRWGWRQLALAAAAVLVLVWGANWVVAGFLDRVLIETGGPERPGVVRYVIWTRPGVVHLRSLGGMTALHEAAGRGRVVTVSLLVAAGADLNAKADYFGYPPPSKGLWGGETPIMTAIAATETPLPQRAMVVATLLAAGADPNLGDKAGATPLHLAAHAGDPATIAALLKAGADVHGRDWAGRTPLHSGATQPQAIALLLAAGAAVNATSANGRTPLHAAVWGHRADAAKVLIAAGANADAADAKGETPLHHAVRSDNAEAVRALLAAGAAANATDAAGMTPLHVAAWKGYDQPAAALLASGADANALDRQGRTPLDCARNPDNRYNENGLPVCRRLLPEHGGKTAAELGAARPPP